MTLVLTTLFWCAAPEGHIAFVSENGVAERMVTVLDLLTGEQLPVGPGNGDGAPVWSPDGSWLAFESDYKETTAIYVVRPDGTEGRFLPQTVPWNRCPVWSPEGSLVAYTAGRGREQTVRVIKPATGEDTVWGGGQKGFLRPVWLPDPAAAAILASPEGFAPTSALSLFSGGDSLPGALLAIGFQGEARSQNTALFVLTPLEAFAMPPWAYPSKGKDYAEWAVAPAPKGWSLAYESDDGGDREIFILTNKGVYDVSNHRAADWNPRWSPDGKWLAFESFRDGPRGIYRVHRDTNRIFPLARSENAGNWSPDWSPRGRWVVHVSDRSGSPDLFITDIRAKKSQRVTRGEGAELAPAWRPR